MILILDNEVIKLNIVYNRKIDQDQLQLFKLIKEFMDIYIKDKSLLDKITIHFNEVEDKNNGLFYIGKCTLSLSSLSNQLLESRTI